MVEVSFMRNRPSMRDLKRQSWLGASLAAKLHAYSSAPKRCPQRSTSSLIIVHVRKSD